MTNLFDAAHWAGPISVTATTPTPLPAPGLTVTNVTQTTSRVNWSGSRTNVSGIGIAVRNLATNALILDTALAASATFQDLSSLTAGTNYRVSVTYNPNAGYAASSEAVDWTTTAAPIPLPAPGLTITNVTQTTSRVNWSGSRTNVSGIGIAVRNLATNALILDTALAASATFQDLSSLTAGTNYRVSVTYNPNAGYVASSEAVEWTTVSTDGNGFSFPLGDRHIYTASSDGDGWKNDQDFGDFNTVRGKYHLGEDWNGEGGGNSDCNEPVFSVGSGVVVYSSHAGAGWGNVIVVRYTVSDGSQIEFVYAHLNVREVALSDPVTRGQEIGTVGDADGAYPCHLHLEARTTACPEWGGPPVLGYSTTSRPTGWLDPTDFIASHSQALALGVIYTLYRVGDTTGVAHTASPGGIKGLFAPGQTVRVTFKAENTGATTTTYALCNARYGSSGVTTYRSPKNAGAAPSDNPIGGGVAVSGSGSLGTGQTSYYSFDINTSGYASGNYDLSGVIRQTQNGPNLDSTSFGIGDIYDSTWWKVSQFSIATAPGSGGTGTILGVDVSSNNGVVDWTSLAAQGVRFGWARSTMGVGINDTRYAANAASAPGAGVVFGAYHFAYPIYTGGSNTAVEEAQWFVSRASAQIGPGFLPPALDVEDDGGQNPVISSLSTPALSDWVLEWCREVLRLTGVRPIVYTSSSYANTELDARITAEFPVWIANFGTNTGALDLSRVIPSGSWPSWRVWQFTSRGIMTGNGSTYIDRNVFNGDEAAFQEFIGGPGGGGEPSFVTATEPMLALKRTVPSIMTDISLPNGVTSHFEARAMARRIAENFLNRALTKTEREAISSATPFDDATVTARPVSRQECFKMLLGVVETINGLVRPTTIPTPLPIDIPAADWPRNVVLGVLAWEIADTGDITGGQIFPTTTVPRSRFAKWAVQTMDVLLNPPVSGPTAAMIALNSTVPTPIMGNLTNPRGYTSDYEARTMIQRTMEHYLLRSLTTEELAKISSANPFGSPTIGTGPVARREVFKMLLGALEGVGHGTRPTTLGISLEDTPTAPWQEAIAGANAWGFFTTADTPSSEIYEAARVSRYTFAEWDNKLLALLSIPPQTTYSQWILTTGLTGSQATAGADPDGDGISNLMEFATGTDPTVASSGVRPELSLAGGGALDFIFKRQSGLSRMTYEVQVSENMQDWLPIARSSAGTVTQALGASVQSITDPGGAAPTVTVRVAPSAVDRRFIRLAVRDE